jgi:hypothetical protein
MNLNDLYNEEKVRLDPKCWSGKKIGNPKTKMKGGTRVNNCVPAESVNEMDKSQTPPGRDGSNDSDAGKKEYTAKATTPEKVAKHGEKILNKELNKKQGVAEGSDESYIIIRTDKEGKQDVFAKFDTYEKAQKELDACLAHPLHTKYKQKFELKRKGQQGQQGVAEEYELAGVGVAYELGRRAYKQGMTIRDNPYSATREARKNDEWAKGLERGKHDANDARHFRSSVREQGMTEADGQLDEKSVSQAQFRTMAAAAHNPKFAKKVGISQDVAREFNKADKGSNYKKLPARTTEGEQQKGADYRDPKEVDYDDDYDAMVSRVKKLAGVGPMKTVYDPERRVYRNVPVAVQPKR